ncbi:putative ABC transporter ATP-binding protein [Rubellimicrobium mesophilum DSM 19309]|uniref:Putative ABC transporter ATP-binding protein n=1 Tax=Rubellimicrobium mesophilum DSM 19309 TaxID=442562 RepID=A0A017HMV8_9RHOB|nr:ABC transporter ATP-binding protein [Rubellimicrobium mesophilum]EYD75645.1 putative ABC transporter ATP-binding protein [Rubellimicrobium mesophilum DSM 19309]
MIRIHVRRKAFGDTEVLRGLRLDLAPGERVAVLGPSGVGKSTFLRIVAGVDRAFEGEVQRPDNIAIVFQEPTLLRWRSVLQNLTLTHPGLPEESARAMLRRVGLEAKAGDYPGQLSLGQQRRVALARAFVGRPELLILDEPFVSLDPALAEEMIALTESLIAETRPAVLLVTHVRAEAERLGERIVRLEGSPATLV